MYIYICAYIRTLLLTNIDIFFNLKGVDVQQFDKYNK